MFNIIVISPKLNMYVKLKHLSSDVCVHCILMSNVENDHRIHSNDPFKKNY